jgi:hypothetical protein
LYQSAGIVYRFLGAFFFFYSGSGTLFRGDATMVVAALLSHWRSRASDLERYAPAAAQAFRDAADELAEALNDSEETVSLKEAAILGGYSVDALQRMVASGRIQNFGRKGKPRIRRADAPVKPGHTASALRGNSDDRHISASAVVASVITRR